MGEERDQSEASVQQAQPRGRQEIRAGRCVCMGVGVCLGGRCARALVCVCVCVCVWT